MRKAKSFSERLITGQSKSTIAEPIVLKVPGVTQFGLYTINADVIEISEGNLRPSKRPNESVEWFDFEKLKLLWKSD